MILVISHPDDPHAQRVIELLRAQHHDVLLMNLNDLPERATLTMDYANGGAPAPGYTLDGSEIDLRQVTSVWWRRPQVADVAAIDDVEVRLFTANEWAEATAGLWRLLGDVPWMNDPLLDEAASRKAYQLHVAAQSGLRVPRTLITSDPERARRFIAELGIGNVIFKTFSCTYSVWRETRLVRDGDLEMLDAVRFAPVIFQEYIPADVDLRITAVGPTLFPAAIHSQSTDYPVDFRMSLGQAAVEATQLPDDMRERLASVMRRLGLVYGAIDVRRTPDGDHVFLEVNTAGEFLFVEERTGQPIAQTVADRLARPSANGRAHAPRRRKAAERTPS